MLDRGVGALLLWDGLQCTHHGMLQSTSMICACKHVHDWVNAHDYD